MRLALYQPDIPGNAGAIMRTAACLSVPVDIIGPCGFVMSDKQMRRAGLDYLDQLDLTSHSSWQAFQETRASRNTTNSAGGRLVLLSTQAKDSYLQFPFLADDILLVGRESAGVPADVHAAAEARVKVPMAPDMRSLNVTIALAMVLGESLRQTQGFPKE
jgi:tRNA (cytidine/uridine-2'-O-)-methyltransferase